MVDDVLVDGGSTDVETGDFIEGGSIGMCTTTLRMFSSKELNDDDR